MIHILIMNLSAQSRFKTHPKLKLRLNFQNFKRFVFHLLVLLSYPIYFLIMAHNNLWWLNLVKRAFRTYKINVFGRSISRVIPVIISRALHEFFIIGDLSGHLLGHVHKKRPKFPHFSGFPVSDSIPISIFQQIRANSASERKMSYRDVWTENSVVQIFKVTENAPDDFTRVLNFKAKLKSCHNLKELALSQKKR